MVIERVAKGTARTVGTGIGATIGGFFTNPAVLILAALGIGLFIFKDKISDFVAGFKLPEINIDLPEFPTFELPEFPTFELPEFPTFELPEFTLCSLFGIGCDAEAEEPEEPIESSEGLLSQEERDECACGTSIVQDFTGLVTETCLTCGPPPPPPPEEFPDPPPEPDPLPPPPEIIIDPDLDVEGDFVGGGPSFIGGSIGQTPVTTLFQVLDLFPKMSASQAANFLFLHSGISPSDALNLPAFFKFQ